MCLTPDVAFQKVKQWLLSNNPIPSAAAGRTRVGRDADVDRGADGACARRLFVGGGRGVRSGDDYCRRVILFIGLGLWIAHLLPGRGHFHEAFVEPASGPNPLRRRSAPSSYCRPACRATACNCR